MEFLKVELTHPDNTTGSQITPAYIRLNRTHTGPSVLHMISLAQCGGVFSRSGSGLTHPSTLTSQFLCAIYCLMTIKLLYPYDK